MAIAAFCRPAAIVPVLLLLALLLAGVPAAGGAEQEVDLELVLAVDVSMSMDAGEIGLQRRGYLEAFRSKEVAEAIVAGAAGRIAVTYMEWAGRGHIRFVVPWMLIEDRQTANAFADRLQMAVPSRIDRTSISTALAAAGGAFDDNGFDGFRRVIDISGDGPNNDGAPLPAIRDELVAAGITINGLALMVNRGSIGFGIDNLDEYYRACVTGGYGSFVLPVKEWSQFARALKLKLLLEISGATPPVSGTAEPVQFRDTGRPQSDCLIGEAIWQRFIDKYGGGGN